MSVPGEPLSKLIIIQDHANKIKKTNAKMKFSSFEKMVEKMWEMLYYVYNAWIHE